MQDRTVWQEAFSIKITQRQGCAWHGPSKSRDRVCYFGPLANPRSPCPGEHWLQKEARSTRHLARSSETWQSFQPGCCWMWPWACSLSTDRTSTVLRSIMRITRISALDFLECQRWQIVRMWGAIYFPSVKMGFKELKWTFQVMSMDLWGRRCSFFWSTICSKKSKICNDVHGNS